MHLVKKLQMLVFIYMMDLDIVYFQCGLVIVDSPGIGENEAMDSVIADFIQSNEIMGYVYVIKSDNSGGVDEDRVG